MEVTTMYKQLKVIGCKGHTPSEFDQRFVKCNECPAKYNDKNCHTCRTVNILQLVFE